MYAILLMITFIAGINYGNNLILGLCFFLASLFIVTIHATFSHLSKLQLKLIEVSNTQVGDFVAVVIEVSSQSKRAHRQIRLSFARDVFSYNQPLQPTKATVNASLPPIPSQHILLNQVKDPTLVTLWLPAKKRGVMHLPRLTVSTVYPLGVLQAWSYVFFEGKSWVYPAPLAYDIQATQLVTSDDEQEYSGQSQAGQDDFDQLDNYMVGETLARISWKHLARGQGLLSKRFVDAVGQEQLLDYYQMPALNHEEKLQQLRYGIDNLSQSHAPFRLRLPDGEGVTGQGLIFEQDSLLRLAKTP